MSFSVDVVNLVLYSAQQLGVMLGVGAASILLVAYLVSIRDGAVDSKEEQFGRAVNRVQTIGLWLIILSGLAITAIHISGGALDIVLSPAFLFKWMLIGLLFGASLFRRGHAYPHFIWEGIIGANWYALFVVHILAPVAMWIDLFVIYAIWSIGFLLCYVALVYAMRAPKIPHEEKKVAPTPPVVQKKVEEPKLAPKPIQKPIPPPQPKPIPKPVPPPPAPAVVKPVPPPPPPMPKPAPLPVVAQSHELRVQPPLPPAPKKPALEVPHKPAIAMPVKPPIKPEQKIPDLDENPGLPAIRVMPRSPADVDKQNRASTVQF